MTGGNSRQLHAKANLILVLEAQNAAITAFAIGSPYGQLVLLRNDERCTRLCMLAIVEDALLTPAGQRTAA